MTVKKLMRSTCQNGWIGSLVGLAIGDQLGCPLEGKPPGTFEQITDMLPDSFWTDDTAQALCLADSLISVQGLDRMDQLQRYVRWLCEGYMSSQDVAYGCGQTARQAITAFRDNGTPTPVEAATSNGALMRLAPIPLFYAKNLATAVQMAGESAIATHSNPICAGACRLYASMIVKAVNGASKPEILDYQADLWQGQPLTPSVDQVAQGSYRQKEPPQIRGTIHIVEVMEAALWAFDQSSSFAEGALLAVNLGNDTDTTGAIFGQLGGAYYGYNGIPNHWKEQLVDRALIEYMAQKLFEFRQQPAS